jgi:hypothetical protein
MYAAAVSAPGINLEVTHFAEEVTHFAEIA